TIVFSAPGTGTPGGGGGGIRPGAGGPRSVTVWLLAMSATEAAMNSAPVGEREPVTVTASPGFTAAASSAERCGGTCTGVPSPRIKPSRSPRGVSVNRVTVPPIVMLCCQASGGLPGDGGGGICANAVVVSRIALVP